MTQGGATPLRFFRCLGICRLIIGNKNATQCVAFFAGAVNVQATL
ncbi:hypothetical protein HMPREF9080_00964 [Cardiobacterium valvarum F0432]|uniref:Uncharacterized protein n=1 Tax=Cardiobacterium valvarum F0432 TaxID=797473 RepID=G9ZDY0_9GAMM|nr:hypothetical protein HMPREF9080_00964 [Cardiobacterium valvarum F0432]